MDVFWRSHDPSRGSWSRQYRAAVFFHNEKQKMLALELKKKIEAETGRSVATAIEPYSKFYIAEAYHQKHSLRLFPGVMREFEAIYPDINDLVKSTAVTRANGYLGGTGSCDALKKEVDGFGLSQKGKEELLSVVCGHKASSSCPVR